MLSDKNIVLPQSLTVLFENITETITYPLALSGLIMNIIASTSISTISFFMEIGAESGLVFLVGASVLLQLVGPMGEAALGTVSTGSLDSEGFAELLLLIPNGFRGLSSGVVESDRE